MTLTSVRIPVPGSARFVLACSQARAVARDEGIVLMVGADRHEAYLLFDGEGWRIEPASLFDPPPWTEAVRELIHRHD